MCNYCEKGKEIEIHCTKKFSGFITECSDGYALFMFPCGIGEASYIDIDFCPFCGRRISKLCKTCKWYADTEGVCCNGSSENCAEFMWGEDDGCDLWEDEK